MTTNPGKLPSSSSGADSRFPFWVANWSKFALIWYLTIKTGSATVLATASLVGMLPNVILGPFIGTLVDRWNRRWIMFFADSLVALATIALATLFALDMAEVWQIFVIIFIRSVRCIPFERHECFHLPDGTGRTPDLHSGLQPDAQRRAECNFCSPGSFAIGTTIYARHPIY